MQIWRSSIVLRNSRKKECECDKLIHTFHSSDKARSLFCNLEFQLVVKQVTELVLIFKGGPLHTITF